METINYMLPGFYEHYELYKKLIPLFKIKPQWFYDNISIDCIYGNFQFCTWDGGRSFSSYQPANKELIETISQFYKENNIPLRLVYTNSLITNEDLYDVYNNLVITLLHDDINEIVVNSNLLEEYIKTNYPKYKLISSTTKCLKQMDQAIEELNATQYRLICLDYNLNHNLSFLQNRSIEEKEKIELLINPICSPGCPYRKQHYILNSIHMLNYGKPYAMQGCYIKGHPCDPDYTKKFHITYQDIVNTYLPLGITHFKIEGRTFTDLEMAMILADYMVKPEYQKIFILALMQKIDF